ncbi:MAG TPA: hydantoinase/oxoprolinase family protein [Geminicoccaceae bacterium]|nr:hydantoinase/oxoprolinase family protein [Geminicoccaceae bacterium]
MGELVTGLDVGGAHLKAAQVAPSGRVVSAVQVPCPLWQGLDRLELALAQAAGQLAPVRRLAVTMTGELADLFPDRATGVWRIVEATGAALPGAEPRVWAGRRGFVAAADAPGLALDIASANWLASATLVARRLGDALFVDLGSTTTDILLLAGGEVRADGITDRERLATGELVYTGLTRTPVMALAPEAPFAGRRVALMNELFATTADLHRVLGWLPEDADQHPAADGGPKTATGSARRLARMVGTDLADGGPADWRRLAGWLARAQLRRIEDAVALQLSRGLIPEDAPLVGAGCGRFLLEPLARGLGRPHRDFADLIEAEPGAAAWAATCAPAVAVALLVAEAR